MCSHTFTRLGRLSVCGVGSFRLGSYEFMEAGLGTRRDDVAAECEIMSTLPRDRVIS